MLIIVKAENELTLMNLSVSFAQLAEAAENYLHEVGLDPGRSIDDSVPSAFAAGTEYHDDFFPDDDTPEMKYSLFVPWLIENGHAEMETNYMEVDLA